MVTYGYKIKDGKAIVDKRTAKHVSELFTAYLSGISLKEAGRKAGIVRCHASIGFMLKDKRYIGDGFYPQIIDGDLFDKLQVERQSRAEASGKRRKPRTQERGMPTLRFHAPAPGQLYDDPFKQAEYAYSLITSEEASDGE